MFDSIGFQELVIIGIIALIVVGPKELPLLMRKAGQWMSRLRGMAADFRANFDEMAPQAELDELRKEVEALRNNTPLQDIKDELADVLTYCILLADKYDLDIEKIILEKLEKTKAKYPIDKSYGSSEKCDRL